MVVATKFGMDMGGANGDAPGGSREYVRRALDASLDRLGRDHVDLYYYHRPDGVTPLEETLGAMHELVAEGKVRWLGLSNVDATQLREAAAFAERGSSPIVAVQNRYSLMHRDDDTAVLPVALEHGIGYVPYFPLESGLLTGKYRRGEAHPEGARLTGADDGRLSDERLAQVEALEAFATRHGQTLLELAIGGLASIAGVASVIAGATSPEQVRANASAGSLHLTDAELEELASDLRPGVHALDDRAADTQLRGHPVELIRVGGARGGMALVVPAHLCRAAGRLRERLQRLARHDFVLPAVLEEDRAGARVRDPAQRVDRPELAADGRTELRRGQRGVLRDGRRSSGEEVECTEPGLDAGEDRADARARAPTDETDLASGRPPAAPQRIDGAAGRDHRPDSRPSLRRQPLRGGRLRRDGALGHRDRQRNDAPRRHPRRGEEELGAVAARAVQVDDPRGTAPCRAERPAGRPRGARRP